MFTVELIGEQLKLTTGSLIMCAIIIRLVRPPYIIAFPSYLRPFVKIFAAICCVGRYRPASVSLFLNVI